MKTVGQTKYFLVENSTRSVPDMCISSCVYQREDVPNSRFCFAQGRLPVTCEEEAEFEPAGYPDLRVTNSICSPVKGGVKYSDCTGETFERQTGLTFTQSRGTCKIAEIYASYLRDNKWLPCTSYTSKGSPDSRFSVVAFDNDCYVTRIVTSN